MSTTKKTTAKASAKAAESIEINADEIVTSDTVLTAAPAEETAEYRRAKVTRKMNVRAKPSMGNTKIVAVINKDTEISVMAEENDWVKIESKDTKDGFAFVWTDGGKNVVYF